MIVGNNRAFTSKYDRLSNQLRNLVVISANEKKISVEALWDTGATNTTISKKVVSDLELIPTGKRPIRTPSGESVYNTYLVNIILPNNVMVEGIDVCESEIGNQGIGVLIGMDIIGKGDFAVSNYDGKTVFTFRTPSIKLTDYVQQNAASRTVGKLHGKGNKKR